MAEDYINTEYAYDARCVGSIPTIKNGKFIHKNSGNSATVKLPPSEWDASNYTRPTKLESDDTGCYDTDNNYETDQKAMEKANLADIKEDYWLAPRNVRVTSEKVKFCVPIVNGGSGNIQYFAVCTVNINGSAYGESSFTRDSRLRICISLKSNIIKITRRRRNGGKSIYNRKISVTNHIKCAFNSNNLLKAHFMFYSK